MTQIYINDIQIAENCYTGDSIINSVDLHCVPFVNNNMYNSFGSCSNLTSVTNLNENITCMWSAFHNCQKLVSMPTIPNGVTNMAFCFGDCHTLNNFTAIPNTVTNIAGLFTRCYNMTQAPELNCPATDISSCFSQCNNLTVPPTLPGTATDLTITFSWCENLSTPPQIPLSVTDMYGTFAQCYNLNTMPILPESVINMRGAFQNTHINTIEYLPRHIDIMTGAFVDCNNLQTLNSTIPTSVTEIGAFTNSFSNSGAFDGCVNLTGNIYITSENIRYAHCCFNNTSLTKNVFIPFKYTNDVNTNTYNAFTNAGYTTDGSVNGVYLKNIQETHNLALTITPASSNVSYNIQSCIPLQNDQEYMYAWEYNGGSGGHYKSLVLLNTFLPTDGDWVNAFTTLSSGMTIPQKINTTDIKFQVMYQHGASVDTYHYNYTRNPQKDGYYTTIPSGQTYSCSAPVHSIIRYTASATGYQSTPGEVTIEDTDVAQTVILEPNP